MRCVLLVLAMCCCSDSNSKVPAPAIDRNNRRVQVPDLDQASKESAPAIDLSNMRLQVPDLDDTGVVELKLVDGVFEKKDTEAWFSVIYRLLEQASGDLNSDGNAETVALFVSTSYDLDDAGHKESSHAPWFIVAVYQGVHAPLQLVGREIAGGHRDVDVHSIAIVDGCLRIKSVAPETGTAITTKWYELGKTGLRRSSSCERH